VVRELLRRYDVTRVGGERKVPFDFAQGRLSTPLGFACAPVGMTDLGGFAS
jgi:hypothetical protein